MNLRSLKLNSTWDDISLADDAACYLTDLQERRVRIMEFGDYVSLRFVSRIQHTVLQW
jgi:hypothetical protein